jgi:hypothetical protein
LHLEQGTRFVGSHATAPDIARIPRCTWFWCTPWGAMLKQIIRWVVRHRPAADPVTWGLAFSAFFAMVLAAYLVFGGP